MSLTLKAAAVLFAAMTTTGDIAAPKAASCPVPCPKRPAVCEKAEICNPATCDKKCASDKAICPRDSKSTSSSTSTASDKT